MNFQITTLSTDSLNSQDLSSSGASPSVMSAAAMVRLSHPVGAFNLVQGSLRIFTSQLDFTRANLTFAGDLSPQLDFLATTQAGGATITVAITGDPADHLEPRYAAGRNPVKAAVRRAVRPALADAGSRVGAGRGDLFGRQ